MTSKNKELQRLLNNIIDNAELTNNFYIKELSSKALNLLKD